MPTSEEIKLAAWRRQGDGIWSITYSIAGFKEPATILLPGRLKQDHAVRVGRLAVSTSHGCQQKHVHHLHTEHES